MRKGRSVAAAASCCLSIGMSDGPDLWPDLGA